MDEKKRKTIILTFIGALTLLFVVVGGTYAYFQIIDTSKGETSTDFEAQTDTLNKYGIPKLTKKSDLYINLSASDMAYSKRGTSYWATEAKEPQDINYEKERKDYVISTASIEMPTSEDAVEDAYLKCTSELTITINGSMKDKLKEGDGKLYLRTIAIGSNKGSINPQEFDLASLVNNEEKIIVNYSILGYTYVDVTAAVEIVNKDDKQNDLAGKNIEITINNNNLSCSVSEKPDTLGTLRKVDPNNYLSTDPVGGLFRYQGLYNNEINNYICLGDNCCKEESCPSDNNDDMYRIIGINKNGELKVIKRTALVNTSVWWSDYETNIKWPQSLIFQTLNGQLVNSKPNLNDITSYYYSLDSNLKNLIINNNSWLYGDTESSGNFDGKTMYGIKSGSSDATYYNKTSSGNEKIVREWNETVEAPIGLMYLSDYYFAYKTNEKDAGNPGNSSNALKSWIHISHNESTPPSGSSGYEWTMDRYGYIPTYDYYNAWNIISYGNIYNLTLNNAYAIRPTFYLSFDITLTGGGTLTNPFRINGVG